MPAPYHKAGAGVEFLLHPEVYVTVCLVRLLPLLCCHAVYAHALPGDIGAVCICRKEARIKEGPDHLCTLCCGVIAAYERCLPGPRELLLPPKLNAIGPNSGPLLFLPELLFVPSLLLPEVLALPLLFCLSSPFLLSCMPQLLLLSVLRKQRV